MSVGVWLIAEVIAGQFYTAELRAWDSPAPSSKDGAPTLKGNPYLLFEFAPGIRREQSVVVTINKLGMRGPEVEMPKPDGVRRFITTGDSSVFGFGVEDSEVFSAYAADQCGYKVESINAAVPGYSTFQSINLLRLRGLKTEPDLFVIGNIWSDNNFDSFIDKELMATYSGYEQSNWGQLKEVLSLSSIYRVADWKLRVSKRAKHARKVGWTLGSANHLGARRVDINDYAQNLETMVQMAKSIGAEVLFMLLANEEDINQVSGDRAWTPYREVMAETADRHGAPMLRIGDLFRATGMSKEQLFLDEMHPTKMGHQVIGKALADLLMSADWPNGGSVMGKGDGSDLPEYVDPFIKGIQKTGSFSGKSTVGSAKITGDLKYSKFKGGVIQLDALLGQSRNAEVLNMIKLDKPGPFVIPIGLPRKVALRAYIDPEGDGPDADDPLIDLTDTVLDLDQNPFLKITIDLDNKTVTASD
jgi:lysophospholipase L1-like esterase